MSFTETEYADRAALAAAVAKRIADDLRKALSGTGRASLIVPGGTTPVAVFDILAGTPLPWENVTVIPCDERWVAPEHADSNEGLVRRHLLQGQAEQARFFSLYRQHPTPVDALAEVAKALQAVPRPFSSVFLGMGEDGHFASLFPGRAETGPALDLNAKDTIMILREPAKGHPRIGLTLRALTDAPRVLLAVSGAEKRIVLKRAMVNIDDNAIPIAALLRQKRTSIDILLSE